MPTEICATVKAKFKCKVAYKEYELLKDQYSILWRCCDENGDCCNVSDSCTDRFYKRILEIEDFSVSFSPIVNSSQIEIYNRENRPGTLEMALRLRAESMFANESWDAVKQAARNQASATFSDPPSNSAPCATVGSSGSGECTLQSFNLIDQTTTRHPVNPPESWDFEVEYDIPNICVPPDN